MAYKVSKVSPSSLAATETCPRFRPDGKENDAAAEGTLLHACLEEMVSVPQGQWASWTATRDLSAEHKGLLEEAANQLQSILMGWTDYTVYTDFRLKTRNGKPRKAKLRPGLYPECEIERGQGRHGYIDLMIVKPDGFVVIIDWKFVRQEGHDYELQLGAYACDVNRICPAHTEFECRIVAPRLTDDAIESHLWDADSLKAIADRISLIEARADQSANDDSILGCPGDYCQYCHWAGKCKYQAQTALQVADRMDVIAAMMEGTAYEGEPLTRETFMAPATTAQRGLRRAFIKFFKSVVDQWVDDDKAWTSENKGVEVPGWKIGWRSGRASLDKSRMPEIRDAIMSKLGLSEDDVDMVSVVDLSLLKELLVTNLGYSEKLAAQKVQEALDSLMTVGAPYTVWTQSKPKKMKSGDFIEVK